MSPTSRRGTRTGHRMATSATVTLTADPGAGLGAGDHHAGDDGNGVVAQRPEGPYACS